MLRAWRPYLGCILLCLTYPASIEGLYVEELFATWLSKTHVLVRFHFTQQTAASAHHVSFPGPISKLAVAVPFDSIDITLTHGKWRYGQWALTGGQVKPAGAELHARFNSTISAPVLARHWSFLTQTLSGLLCASLNLLKTPDKVARRQLHLGLIDEEKEGHNRQLYGFLPREAVCTENLTPWLKLLPCRDVAGIAQLLTNRSSVFGADYASVALGVHRGSTPLSVVLTQSLTLVLRASKAAFTARQPLPLQHLLAANISRLCPSAVISRAYLQLDDSRQSTWDSSSLPTAAGGSKNADVQLSEHAQCSQDTGGRQTGSRLRVAELRLLPDLVSQIQTALVLPPPPSPLAEAEAAAAPAIHSCLPVTVERYATGSGLLHGQLVLAIHKQKSHGSSISPAPCNMGPFPNLICIYQVVPWYIRLWVHALRLSLDGKEMPLNQHLVGSHISPAIDRKSPMVVDLCLKVPNSTTSVQLSADFTKGFLTAFEYPPDAHRGFDVPAAIVSFPSACTTSWVPNNHSMQLASPLTASLVQGPVQEVYTDGLLVPLAAPDFSMPYNVICLSSTVLAVFIGATFNTIIKRAPGEQAEDAQGSKAARTKRAVLLVAAVVVTFAVAIELDEGFKAQVQDWIPF